MHRPNEQDHSPMSICIWVFGHVEWMCSNLQYSQVHSLRTTFLLNNILCWSLYMNFNENLQGRFRKSTQNRDRRKLGDLALLGKLVAKMWLDQTPQPDASGRTFHKVAVQKSCWCCGSRIRVRTWSSARNWFFTTKSKRSAYHGCSASRTRSRVHVTVKRHISVLVVSEEHKQVHGEDGLKRLSSVARNMYAGNNALLVPIFLEPKNSWLKRQEPCTNVYWNLNPFHALSKRKHKNAY